MQASLEQAGIAFDCSGGFKVVDTHASEGLLSFTFKDTEYTGYLDGVVVPYGSLSYELTARLGFELKYNQVDKESRKRKQRSAEAQQGVAASTDTSSGMHTSSGMLLRQQECVWLHRCRTGLRL